MKKIAIDGYTGSGKSTLARALAEKTGFKILDTGAIFRALAYGFAKKKLELCQDAAEKFAKESVVEVEFLEDGQHMFLNGKDVTKFIRSEEVSQMASKISVFPLVREKYLKIAKAFAEKYDCIMEGRDIGTVVMPDADLKIFLTAEEKTRAQRRFDEQVARGEHVELKEILKDLKQRDKRDTTREIAPLKPTSESIVVDNSDMTFDQTVDFCLNLVEKTLGRTKHINIAIDGYVCSGKSTIAKALAKRLNFKVLDTGAIYRGVACAFDYMGLDENKIDENYIQKFSKQISVRIFFSDGLQHVVVNGIDHTPNLRTEKTSALAAKISPFQCVRDKVLALQREFAKNNDLCMEGRDIGSHVLPDADFKFFCTADENTRAQRRYEQQRAMGNDVEFADILKELRARDYADEHREHGAIKMCPDSILLDTTNQTLEQSVEFCLKKIAEKHPEIVKSK